MEKALDETRYLGRGRGDQLGDLNPTAAIKLLLGRPDLTTVRAADEIKRIGAIIGAAEPGSVFARALSVAFDRARRLWED